MESNSQRSNATPKSENNELDKIEHWIENFLEKEQSAIGLLLVEEDDGKYALVYVSPRICKYYGFEAKKYPQVADHSIELDELLDIFNVSRSDYDKLTKAKKINIWVNTKNSSKKKRVNLSYNSYTYDGNKICEILVYDDLSVPPQSDFDDGIFVRTFGHFDMFINGKPIAFSSAKEKELMALLIDRNGGTLSSKDAISYLWEDTPVDLQLSAKYRKVAMGLKNTLEKYGIENIIINNHGVRSVDTSKVKCDYYEMLAGNEKYISSFRNVYMSDYSWAEETLATLWDYT